MALVHSPSIVTSGLVLCLDAANSKSYPGSGDIWTDLSGNGNTGTLSATNIGYNSANGGSLVFDGTDDYVDIGKTATQLGIYDADYTFDAWVYPTNSTGDRTMFGTDQIVSGQGLHLVFRNGTIYQGHYASDFAAGSATLNAWNNITFTFIKSSGTATIYKNGILQGSGTISSFIGSTNILIGRWATSFYFLGNSSNYKIYNRALTAAEIAQNYNALKGAKNGGKKAAEINRINGGGFWGIPIEERRKNSRKGGKITGEKHKKNGTGIFGRSKEKMTEDGKKGGKKAAETNKKNGTSFYGIPIEERRKNSRKAEKITNSQKWECCVTGYVSTAAGVVSYQKARKIDTSKSNRKRIS